jgi:hypothetical protein
MPYIAEWRCSKSFPRGKRLEETYAVSRRMAAVK